jgi:WD40 repeat protein
MAMHPDAANQRVFFGTESGKVLVYSYARDSLKQMISFEGHVGVVRALFYDPTEQYLFSGGFDCSVMIWKVGPPGDEGSGGRKVGVLRGGPPSRIKAVVFCPTRRQVMAGHQNGAITFWNTRDGSVLNVVQPHVLDVVDLQWFSEEQKLVSCSRDGFCSIWSLKPDALSVDPPVYEKKDLYAQLMLPE